MNIYYYGIFKVQGGIETFAKNLIDEIKSKREDINFIILAITPTIAYEDFLSSLGCKIIHLPNPAKHPFAFLKQLNGVLNNANHDDIVQLNVCSYRNIMLFQACKKTNAKTIVVSHYTKIGDGRIPFLHYLSRRYYRKLGIKVGVSNDAANFMFGQKTPRVIIPNGINAALYSFSIEKRNKVRQQIGIDDETLLIGQIGRISKEKNQCHSISVMNEFHKSNPNSKLLFVGKEYDPEPRKLVDFSNSNHFISFFGEVIDGVNEIYSALDIVFFPSLHEAVGLSLLECAANGVPTIVSSNVPQLSNMPNLHYLDLFIDEWVAKTNQLKNDKLCRVNYVLNSVYTISACANGYLNIYDNFDQYLK